MENEFIMIECETTESKPQPITSLLTGGMA